MADRIYALLEQKGMSQKDPAVALHKSESDISKWFSGTHNLVIKPGRVSYAISPRYGITHIYVKPDASLHQLPHGPYAGDGELAGAVVADINSGLVVYCAALLQ